MRRAAVTGLLIAASAGGVGTQTPPRVAELDATIEALMDRGHFPGAAVAVMRDGEPVHVGAYGLASIAHEAPGYGRGWQVHVVDGRRVLTHGGYAGTGYLRFVDDGLSVIVLTNRKDAPDVAHAVEPAIPAAGLRCWE